MGAKRSRWKISHLPAASGFFGGVLAVAIALTAQHALLADRVLAAAFGYGLAIVVLLAGLAAASEGEGPELPGEPAAARSRSPSRLGLLLSTGLVAAACVLVWKSPRSRQVFPAVLWALGLLLLVLSLPGRGARRARPSLPAGLREDGPGRGIWEPGPRQEAILAAAMLLLAGALRIARLDQHPGLFGDEGEMGMNARAILEGRPAPVFAYGWGAITNLLYYAMAGMLRLFGDDLVGLRMLPVLGGLAAVFLVYRIGRLLRGPRAGLLAGTLLAAQPLALQFSRFGTNSGWTGTLWAAGFLFLFRALRFGAPRDAALSGIAFASSLYLYPSGKLVFLLLPAVALYLLLVARGASARNLAPGLAILGLAFLLTFSPHAVTSLKDGWKTFTARYQERAIFAAGNRPEAFARAGLSYDPAWQHESLPASLARHPLAWGRVLFTQTRDSLEVLYRKSDPTAFYNIREHRGSMLSPVMASLTLLGLVYATAKVLDPRFGLPWLWFWGGLLGPALTLDTPSVQRLTGAWPAAMLLAALLLDSIAASAWPLGVSFARRWVALGLGALLLIVTAQGIREYFVHYRSLAPYADSTTQARYAQTLGTTYKVYQLGIGDGSESFDVFFNYGSTRFLAKGVEGTDVTSLSDILPVTDDTAKGVVFLVRDSNADSLPILRSVYPGGREEIVRSFDGIPRFTAYKLDPAQFAGFHALRATYIGADGRSVETDEPNLGTHRADDPAAWHPPPGLSYPASATWEGSLIAPEYGLYRFTLSAEPGARLSLDETLAAKSLEWLLAKGPHHVRLSGLLRSAESRIAVASAFESAAAQPVARRYLFRENLGGLTGEVWRNPGTRLPTLPTGPPSARRVDPAIGFREARNDPSFGRRPFVARWSGRIRAEFSGEYLFEARSNGSSILTIDGRQAPLELTGAPVTVALQAGPHDLDLFYEWEKGRARLDVYWTPPSGCRELIPPSALSPERRSWPLEGPPPRRSADSDLR